MPNSLSFSNNSRRARYREILLNRYCRRDKVKYGKIAKSDYRLAPDKRLVLRILWQQSRLLCFSPAPSLFFLPVTEHLMATASLFSFPLQRVSSCTDFTAQLLSLSGQGAFLVDFLSIAFFCWIYIDPSFPRTFIFYLFFFF